MSGNVELRPVAAGDRAFLCRVYASTRTEELAVVPWDDAQKEAFLRAQFDAQDRWYRANYTRASYEVILVDGERAGRLYVHRGRDDIRIIDITLVPAFRRRGIGTGLLRALIAEAEESGRKLSIHVELNNPARTVYERLGFRPAGEHGVYTRMERIPQYVDTTT